MYHSSSSSNVFMMNNMPSGVKKHCKSTDPEIVVADFPSFFFLLLQTG